MSPRLAELLRQRRLLKEHSDWLDQEIAREQGLPTAEPTLPALPVSEPVKASSQPPAPVAAAEAEAEEILRQFEPEVRSASEEAKRGCFIAFGILMLAIAAVVGAAFLFYGDTPAQPVRPAVEKAR